MRRRELLQPSDQATRRASPPHWTSLQASRGDLSDAGPRLRAAACSARAAAARSCRFWRATPVRAPRARARCAARRPRSWAMTAWGSCRQVLRNRGRYRRSRGCPPRPE
eukprot:3017366-Prymnesium_polylepis.1